MNGPNLPHDPPPEYSPEVTALLAALAKEKGGFGLDGMLRGAFRALKDEENPESFVHCAQSARELMEKFEHAKHGLGKAELRDEHRENFKDRTDRHAKAWQSTKDKSKAYKKCKWRGKIDEPVVAFLTETDDFFEWFANHDLYRKNKVEAIVLRLDPMFSALSQVDQERIAREWVDLRGFFTQVAHHHDRGLTRAAMDDALARLVRYLHRRLAPVDAANKEAIRAHIREWEKKGVTDEALPPKGLLESGADNAFFFANLQSPDWVRVLDRAGYFKSPPEPFPKEGAEWHPVWPQSRYLIGAASKSGAEVATAIAGIPVTKNLNVNEDLFRAAVQLPAEHVPKVVKRVRPWIKTANIRLHSRNLAKFVRHLASDKIGTALGVLEDAISFAPGEWPEGEKPKKKSMFNWEPEPVARFDSYEYNEVLTAAIPTLVKAKALVTVGSLSKVLDGYIEARGRKDRRRGYDGSVYWRPSIEDSGQNSLYEEVTSLISTLRDIGDGELKANRVSLSALLVVTAKFAPDIFRRLEMHWLRTGLAQATPAQLRGYLLKELHFRSGRFEREYGLLLQAGFTKLAKKEQAKILRWIAKGPDLPKGARGKDARGWADSWRVKKYFWIKDSLPPALRRRYDGWAAKGLEPEHPGFASWTGGFEEVTRQSPMAVDAFRALSVPEQTAYLKTWQPAGDKWNGPSRSGLAGVLHKLPGALPNGLFWIVRPGNEPFGRASELVKTARSKGITAEFVEANSFDEMMTDVMLLERDLPTQILQMIDSQRPRVTDAPLPPTEGGWPVIRLNALPISSYPMLCRKFHSTVGGMREVRHAVEGAGRKVIAGRRKAGVLGFGRDEDFREAFAAFSPSDFDIHSIETRRLEYDSAELSLLYDALCRALSRERHLIAGRRQNSHMLAVEAAAADERFFAKLKQAVGGELHGTVPGTEMQWHEAVLIRLEYRVQQLWLLFEPTTWITNLKDDSPFEAVKEFQRNRAAARYNQKWNHLFEAWSNIFCGGDKETSVSAFGISDGVDAKFRIHSTTGFSRRIKHT